jgi:hypothetical protein
MSRKGYKNPYAGNINQVEFFRKLPLFKVKPALILKSDPMKTILV